ncbi:hypothetical protein MNV49_004879 [Pseudohyphozyma bogoriensis]|nr:hypothetical protein MNV49_004879 [Pseudohyphozyma bogoriensis]
MTDEAGQPQVLSALTHKHVFSTYSCAVLSPATSTQPLPIYSPSYSAATNTHSGFIEAVAGREFKVVQTGPTSSSVAVWGEGDGTSWGGIVVNSDKFVRGGQLEYRVEFASVNCGQGVERPFMFAPLLHTDDPKVASFDPHHLSNLGTLKIRLYRVSSIQPSPSSNQAKDPKLQEIMINGRPYVPPRPVFEGQKAMFSHQTWLGAAREADQDRTAESSKVGYLDEGKPLVTFEFKYLSRDLLEIRGLIPRAPDEKPDIKGDIELYVDLDNNDDVNVEGADSYDDAYARHFFEEAIAAALTGSLEGRAFRGRMFEGRDGGASEEARASTSGIGGADTVEIGRRSLIKREEE